MPLQTARLRSWIHSLLRVTSLLVVLAAASTAQAAQQGSLVAIVNSEGINDQKLAQEALRRYGKDILDNMINRQLILQQCKKQGITITGDQVRQEIERTAAKFKLSMPLYLQLLQEERDISPGQYSREIVWPMMALRQLVADQIKVSDAELNQAFAAEYGEAVKCRMIMVSDKDRINSLHQQASQDPEQFAKLAQRYSEERSSASVGGLIPAIRRGTGDPSLENAAFALAAGSVSAPMQLGDQWVILQAVKRIAGSTPSPKAMPLVRAQITDRIRDSKMKGAAAELFARLKKEAKVVKVLGNPELEKQYPGVAAIINGQQISIAMLSAECVKRHGTTVLDGEINRTLIEQELIRSKVRVTDADLQAEVDRAAVSFGFVRPDGSADRQAWLDSILKEGEVSQDLYIADTVWPSVALRKLVEPTVTLSELDLQNGFESSFGPRVQVLACVLSDQRTAQKVWELARANPTEAFFSQLAEQYSVEPVSSSNMGKVPPIRKHGGQPAIEKEAFSLKPGELSGIVASGDQYIVMYCQGYTEPLVTNLQDVRADLVEELTEKKITKAMAKRFEDLKSSAQIENLLEAARDVPLQAITEPKSAARPAAARR